VIVVLLLRRNIELVLEQLLIHTDRWHLVTAILEVVLRGTMYRQQLMVPLQLLIAAVDTT
jgi:hypothetical protein